METVGHSHSKVTGNIRLQFGPKQIWSNQKCPPEAFLIESAIQSELLPTPCCSLTFSAATAAACGHGTGAGNISQVKSDLPANPHLIYPF